MNYLEYRWNKSWTWTPIDPILPSVPFRPLFVFFLFSLCWNKMERIGPPIVAELWTASQFRWLRQYMSTRYTTHYELLSLIKALWFIPVLHDYPQICTNLPLRILSHPFMTTNNFHHELRCQFRTWEANPGLDTSIVPQRRCHVYL